MSCPRCAARKDPEKWFKEILPRDLKRGIAPEWVQCLLCHDVLPLFGREEFINRSKLFTSWLRLHHRELPSWLIPAHVSVMLSHGYQVDNYIRFLAWGE